MIIFQRVTDEPKIAGRERLLAADVDMDIPPGRYALLTDNILIKKPAVDLIAGLRPPHIGRIDFGGLTSWPIGRPAFLRGKVTGRHVVMLLSGLYGLDVRLANAILENTLTEPGNLDEVVEYWSVEFRHEFGFAVALLPSFDVYIVEGVFPYLKDRFTYLWRSLFDEKSAYKTLVSASSRVADLTEYCEKAIIFSKGRLEITDDLKAAIDEFPPRPPAPDPQKGFERTDEPADDIL